MEFKPLRDIPCVGIFAAAGFCFSVYSELPAEEDTFAHKMEKFRVAEPFEEQVAVYHHFTLPEIHLPEKLLYDKSPWRVFETEGQRHYVWTNLATDTVEFYMVVSENAHELHCFHYNEKLWHQKNAPGLLMRTSDHLLFLPLIQQKGGFILHSSAVDRGDHAIVMVGHSGSGKSTATNHFGKDAVVIGEDRNIILPAKDGGYQVCGSWIHYNEDRIHNLTRKVDGLYFLKKAEKGRLEPLPERLAMYETLSHVARGLADTKGWNATVDGVQKFIKKNSCFYLHFEKDGGIIKLLNYRI